MTKRKGRILSEETKRKISNALKGRNPWNRGVPSQFKGIPRSDEVKRKISESHKGRKRPDMEGNKYREGLRPSNWKGGISLIKKYVRKHRSKKTSIVMSKRIKKTLQELLERKRFRNQRYKANKINAEGRHTFNEWLLLKAFYNYMCLCCKRQEPEIKLSEDHIMPLSKGGSDNIDNIQPLCVSCNTRKRTNFINYRLTEGGVRRISLNS